MDKDIEAVAAEYRGFPNKKGRPPKAIARQVTEINKKRILSRTKITPEGKKRVIIAKPDRTERFIEEFLKNGGNATQAALAVSNTKNMKSAASLGHRYLKEAKILGRIMLEKRGFDYGKMLDVAGQKMLESRTPEWWDRLMKIADYDNPATDRHTAPSVVNIVGTQKQLATQFGFADEEVVDGEVEE